MADLLEKERDRCYVAFQRLVGEMTVTIAAVESGRPAAAEGRATAKKAVNLSYTIWPVRLGSCRRGRFGTRGYRTLPPSISARPVDVAGSWCRCRRPPSGCAAPPADVDQHTAEALRDLWLDDDRITALSDCSVIQVVEG